MLAKMHAGHMGEWGMFFRLGAIISFVVAGLAPAALAQSGPCAQQCDELYKKGCPKNHCSGIIENNTCYAHCSGTYAVPPVVQYYFNGKIYEFSTESVKPKDASPK